MGSWTTSTCFVVTRTGIFKPNHGVSQSMITRQKWKLNWNIGEVAKYRPLFDLKVSVVLQKKNKANISYVEQMCTGCLTLSWRIVFTFSLLKPISCQPLWNDFRVLLDLIIKTWVSSVLSVCFKLFKPAWSYKTPSIWSLTDFIGNSAIQACKSQFWLMRRKVVQDFTLIHFR